MARQSNNKKSTELDIVIGERIKIRRLLMNITQNELAKYLNITFQQIQKYEKGKNRVSATTLYNIAQKLCVPIMYFYGCGPLDCGLKGGKVEKICDSGISEEYTDDSPTSPESIDLLQNYYLIRDKNVRKHILDLIRDFQQTC